MAFKSILHDCRLTTQACDYHTNINQKTLRQHRTNHHDLSMINDKMKSKKCLSVVNQRRTDITMDKTKRQTIVYKTYT